MAPNNRLKREAPIRIAPIRNRLVSSQSSPANNSNGNGSVAGAVLDESLKAAQRLAETADATVRSAVERGVETAYMVIEEYMLRGRQTASGYREQRNGRADMNDNRQSYPNWSGAGGTIPPFLAPWIQMMRIWLDMMAGFVPGMAPGGDWATSYGSGRSASGTYPKISVQVSPSAHNPEVVVCIDPGAEYLRLTVDALRPADGRKADPLTGSTIDCESGTVRVRVAVPAKQPEGRYVGAIRDGAGVQRGQLTVVLNESGAGTRKKGSRATPGK